MAKGNLFQGQARGRVGDVVLSRLDGQQVSRVRNRNPRNPNTYRQRLQRAIAANIARLYSAGSAIFNHSWQGAKVGSGAQRRFMKRNMRLLRRLLLADIDNESLSVDSIARVGVPGLSVPVPFAGLQVSAGSLSQEVFSLTESSGGVFWKPRIPDNLAPDATIADYCSLMGLKPGSIFTFIGFNVKSSADYLAKVANDDNNYDAVFPCDFQYAQLRLKASALTDTRPMSSARFVMMFDGVDNSQIGGILVSIGFRVSLIFGDAYADGDTILTACIASKENSPKRSTAFLLSTSSIAHYGLTHQYVSDSWDKSAALDGSELILEGENFPADSPTPTPTPITIQSVQPEPDGTVYGPFAITLTGAVTDSDVEEHLTVQWPSAVNYTVQASPAFGIYVGGALTYRLGVIDNVIQVADTSGGRGPKISGFSWV